MRPSSAVAWREAHPSADDVPELQSLKAKIYRRSVLGALYFTWVIGVTASAGMMLYALYALTRTAVTLNAVPVPVGVQSFCAFMVCYETYHRLTPRTHRRWDAARQFFQYMLNKYPYFRRTVCVFDTDDAPTAATDTGSAGATAPPMSSTAAVLKPKDKALFAFHPHGILSCGFGMNGVHNSAFLRADTRWLVADNLFWFPLMRDLLHWMDSSSVKKESFVELMAQGQNIGFLPGGFEDATLFRRGRHRVFLKHRRGFIKLALQHGYKIYPAYTFGEEQTYHAFPYLLKLRLKLNELKIPAAIFVGNLFCFFMPRSDVDLITVVGTPLELPTIADPTPEDVQKYHAMYVQKLQTLFDKHKAMYASDPHATLEMY